MARLSAPRPAGGALAPGWQAPFIFILVFLIILPAIRSGFVAIDGPLYIGNRHVAVGLTPAGFGFAFRSITDLYWHPLAPLGREIEVSIFGLDPAGHHFTNVLLHGLAAAVLGVLALMPKPLAVCLVPILLLLDYWPLRGSGGIPLWRLHWPGLARF